MADYVITAFPAPNIMGDNSSGADYAFTTTIMDEQPAPPPPLNVVVGGMRGFTIIHPS